MKMGLKMKSFWILGALIIGSYSLSAKSEENYQTNRDRASLLLPIHFKTQPSPVLETTLPPQEVLVTAFDCEDRFNCNYGNSHGFLNGNPFVGRWWVEKAALCRDCAITEQVYILVPVVNTILEASKEDSNIRFEKIKIHGNLNASPVEFTKTAKIRYWVRTPNNGFDPDVSFEDSFYDIAK